VDEPDRAGVSLGPLVETDEPQGMADDTMNRVPVLGVEEMSAGAIKAEDLVVLLQPQPLTQVGTPDAGLQGRQRFARDPGRIRPRDPVLSDC
jgi:hypothetical protein